MRALWSGRQTCSHNVPQNFLKYQYFSERVVGRLALDLDCDVNTQDRFLETSAKVSSRSLRGPAGSTGFSEGLTPALNVAQKI